MFQEIDTRFCYESLRPHQNSRRSFNRYLLVGHKLGPWVSWRSFEAIFGAGNFLQVSWSFLNLPEPSYQWLNPSHQTLQNQTKELTTISTWAHRFSEQLVCVRIPIMFSGECSQHLILVNLILVKCFGFLVITSGGGGVTTWNIVRTLILFILYSPIPIRARNEGVRP